MTDLQDDVRERIAKALPNVLGKAIEDYEKFLQPKENENKKEKETPKEFKDRHDACKAALAHIALIVKTAEQVGGMQKTGGEAQQKFLEDLLLEARKELENQDSGSE